MGIERATRPVRPWRTLSVAAAMPVLLLLGVVAAASARELPEPVVGKHVYDEAGILSPAAERDAQRVIAAMRERTGAQVALVTWPSGLSSVSPEVGLRDARTIMDAWGVGREGVNDGLVILFDMDTSGRHGQIAMATGRGFRDEYLSDVEGERIREEVMVPLAARGDFDGAVRQGLARIDALVVPGGNPAHGDALAYLMPALPWAALAALVVIVFLVAWWRSGRDPTGPLIDDSVLLPAPPPGLSPALATVLRDNRVGSDAFAAALMDLGQRGYLTFQKAAPDKDGVDLVVPVAPLDDPGSVRARQAYLGPAEVYLLRDIAGYADRGATTGWEGVVPRSGRSGSFTSVGFGGLRFSTSRDGVAPTGEAWAPTTGPAAAGPAPGQPPRMQPSVLPAEILRAGVGARLMRPFSRELGQTAARSPWFRGDPTRAIGKWAGIGAVAIVSAVLLSVVLVFRDQKIRPGGEVPGAGLATLAAAGVLVIVGSRSMGARTKEGAYVLAMTLAYRNTLRHAMRASTGFPEALAAAQPRLPWLGTPDDVTVWGTALGLKDEVGDLFARSLANPAAASWTPTWYYGDPHGLTDLGQSLGSITAAPSSRSGSSGDYGGGSSSGGGGGSSGF
jgi:uncharacterized membrane protein YgcG